MVRFWLATGLIWASLASGVFAAEVSGKAADKPDTPDLAANEVVWSKFLAWDVHSRLDSGSRVFYEFRFFEGSRVDLMTPTVAAEIDWAKKWAEGIGQAKLYGRLSERAPVVLLLVRDWAEDRVPVMRAMIALEGSRVKLWVYDCKAGEWTHGPFRSDQDSVEEIIE